MRLHAVSTLRELEEGLDPREYRDRELASNSLKRLRDFVTTYPEVTPIFGREYDAAARSKPRARRLSPVAQGHRFQGRFE